MNKELEIYHQIIEAYEKQKNDEIYTIINCLLREETDRKIIDNGLILINTLFFAKNKHKNQRDNADDVDFLKKKLMNICS